MVYQFRQFKHFLMNGLKVPRFEENSVSNSFCSFIKGEATQILWSKRENTSLKGLFVKKNRA